MSVQSPPSGWFHWPQGHERLWIGLALIWCLIMSVMMPYWHFFGKQNSTGESYAVHPKVFVERTERFVKANTVGEFQGMPLVEPAPGGDAYLLARMWSWYPTLKLRQGETYRIHMSSEIGRASCRERLCIS